MNEERAFNPGDRVVVMRKMFTDERDPATGLEWGFLWLDTMDGWVGKELVVCNSNRDSACLSAPSGYPSYYFPIWLVRHASASNAAESGPDTKLSPKEAHRENYGRLFNTVSSVHDWKYTALSLNDRRGFLNLDHEELRQAKREADYLCWMRRRNGVRESFRQQLTARPDLERKRNAQDWSPKDLARDKHVKRVIKELTAWAEGRNPQAPLSLIRELIDLPQAARLRLPASIRDAEDRYWAVRYTARPAWAGQIPRWQEVFDNTLVRVSDDDPMKVCYIPNLTKLMHGDDGLWTRMRPGRFLAKFHPELSEDKVREWAEKHEAEHAPVELKFVENTDPDGWERVYEAASGFSSCMQYNHPERRFLHEKAHGKDHPVRSYAYPGNGLRLAYIANGDIADADFKVFARAIVRDDIDQKGYIRIFGDGRIKHALKRAGYGEEVELDGVRIARRKASWDSRLLLVPYLDSIGYVDDMDSHLLIRNGGDLDAGQSDGLVKIYSRLCERCGTHVDEDDSRYSGYENTEYCIHCGDNFVSAVVSVGRYGMEYDSVLMDNAIAVNGTWYADDNGLLERAGLVWCVECDEWAHENDVTLTSRGDICGCTTLVELDEEDDDGNSHAHPDDAIEALRLPDLTKVWLHEDKDFDDTGLSDCEQYVLPDSEAHLAHLGVPTKQMDLEETV